MRLYHLERLDMSDRESPGNLLSIHLRLGIGLEQLATLTRLKELVFYPVPQRLSKDDVDWMIKHWKSLKSVEGILGLKDGKESQKLVDMFHAAGIDVQKPAPDRWLRR